MDLNSALKYGSTDLPFARLVERAIQQQRSFRPSPETPTPAHNQIGTEPYLSALKQIDPKADGTALTHLHNAAAVLAGTADPSVLGADFHSDSSPLNAYLKQRLQTKSPVPVRPSDGPVLSSTEGDVSGTGASTARPQPTEPPVYSTGWKLALVKKLKGRSGNTLPSLRKVTA